MQGLQNTSNETFRDVVGNGVRLEVPRFQRDYSWGREHWTDLWDDILQAESADDWHYLGFVVLQRRGDNDFAVIDGQQRLTTLSLLVLAAMRIIRDSGDRDAERRVDVLRASYIGRQDAVTLVTSNKLTLNRNNDQLYRTYLTELREAPRTGLRPSERALAEALRFFETRLKSHVTDDESIARLIEFVAGRFFFTVIRVTSELNAYRVFETLNARGVQLSAADLLKNYLFATVDRGDTHNHELDRLEETWTNILDALGRDPLQRFLWAYWNSARGPVRSSRLYPAMRNAVADPAAAFGLLRELEDAAPLYAALRDPRHELWLDFEEARPHLEVLKLLLVRQYVPLLLAGYQSLDRRTFLQLLRDVVVVSLRYNTIGGQSGGAQEDHYGRVAREIRSTRQYTSASLTPLYPEDSVFVADFKQWSATSSPQGRKIARYILEELEKQAVSRQVVVGAVNVTLEHILPNHPAAQWYPEDDPAWARAPWRLGNLALLEENLNRNAGQKPIADKLAIYAMSAFALTREIDESLDDGAWTERAIERRQARLANLAKAVWKLPTSRNRSAV